MATVVTGLTPLAGVTTSVTPLAGALVPAPGTALVPAQAAAQGQAPPSRSRGPPLLTR